MKGVLNGGLLWKLGLDIPLDGVLVTVIVSHSFYLFIYLFVIFEG